VLRNPLADVTLLAIAIVAVIAIFGELITLVVLASHDQEGSAPFDRRRPELVEGRRPELVEGLRAGDRAPSLRLVLRQVWWTIKKLFHPQGLLMIVYLILLLPLGQLGLTSVLTKKVAVPPFISEELSKNPSQSLLYSGVLLLITYLNLRLILTVPLLGSTSAGVWQAFVTSWRLTRWRSLRILGLFIVLTFAAGLAAFVLGLAALAPTIATDILAPASSSWLAAVGLSVFQICVFVIAALLTIMIVQSLTAMMRDWLGRLGADHQRLPTLISYAEPSQVSPRRQKALWGLAMGVILLAFTITAVLNHRTMVDLVDSEQTQVVAHRGFIQGGVENTLPALQAAAEAGADRVEFDVLETKDGKFVVIHDTNLQRLAGKNLNIKDLTQDELTKITVRAGGMEAKIPTLEEWIQLSIQLNLPQLLEIKLHGAETPDMVPRLLAVLDRAGVTEHYTYHTLSREVVEELHRLRPQLVVGFIVPVNFGGVPNVNADFIVIEQLSYSSKFIRQAWAAGYNVIVWTVDQEQPMRDYMQAAVDGIITDRPDLAIATRTDIAEDKGLADRLSDAITRSASF
jgi:glycerophosphoryl diester phosphodiesterase